MEVSLKIKYLIHFVLSMALSILFPHLEHLIKIVAERKNRKLNYSRDGTHHDKSHDLLKYVWAEVVNTAIMFKIEF